MRCAVVATMLVAAIAASRAASPEEAEPAMEAGFVTTPDGVRLYYQKVGSAPEVVILPGRLFAFTEFEWLGEHYTLVSSDMRNRGRSDLVLDEKTITFEQDVVDLETVRRHFGVERMALIGSSYLGKIVVPPVQSLEHDPAFFQSITGRGFHGGLLDGLAAFYSRPWPPSSASLCMPPNKASCSSRRWRLQARRSWRRSRPPRTLRSTAGSVWPSSTRCSPCWAGPIAT